jgi:hypothetical protein
MQAWLPPDPPPGHGTHRYVFQVFALRSGADLSATPGRHEVIDAIANYAVACGYLIGTYERAQRAPLESLDQKSLRESMDNGAASVA